ncbi:sensor domain-containing diguanylate cyclase [Caldichromatium japonicum]|uniref:diguanylate cyclase n=1 Tax=Caldichromatium japonicum TaxID=2699430 RepID=A0A6G7VCR8_9GAMM|nr:sensor domain-containing diguanylate cyclase [Caldichromatium japonicum]QIK37666.1 sensor domain-containing diguanylate cyclase [Caldichromatium japonicum]
MDLELVRQVLDSLQVGLVLLDRAGRVVSWNDWMRRHSGLEFAAVQGQRLTELFPEIQDGRLAWAIDEALRFRLSSMLAPTLNPAPLPIYRRPGDRERSEQIQQLIYITPLQHPVCACLIQIHDMTAPRRRERRLRDQSSLLIETSYQDPLTKVGNRRRFDQDLSKLFQQARERQRPLALLMIDVDHFKSYNDHFGHPAGDACLREGDRIARYGGEEFVALLPDTDQVSACAIAERLRLAVAQLALPHPYTPLGQVTVSIGVAAMTPSPATLCYTLVAQADIALYSSKDAGRNRCLWYDAAIGKAQTC